MPPIHNIPDFVQPIQPAIGKDRPQCRSNARRWLSAVVLPDVVTPWSDDEIAVPWWNLFPQRRLNDGSAAEPTEFELNQIRFDCSAESWLDLVKNFRKRYRTEAGRPATLQSVSSRRRSRRHANSSV